MNKQRWPWVLAIVIGVAVVVIVGVAAYSAGLNATAVGPGNVREPLMFRTFGHHDGFGFGFGLGPLGFLVGIGLIALLVAGLVALFSRSRDAATPPAGPRSTSPTGPIPPEARSSFESWHREAHGLVPDAPSTQLPPNAPAQQAPAPSAQPPSPPVA